MGDGRHAGEEAHGLVHFHLQHVADALAAPGDGQRLGVEARAVADVAGQLHIGQEAHLDGLHALAFAARAAAVAGVEAEAGRGVAARPRFQGLGVELADGVPEADVGGRAAARGLADGGLVHFQHTVDVLVALQALAAGPPPVACQCTLNVCQQHVTRQRALAAAADARHGHQAAQRHAQVHLLQVVQRGAAQHQRGGLPVDGTARHQRVLQRARQQAAGHRIGLRRQVGRRALRHQAPAALAGAGADVDDVFGATDGVFVVLHHHQRVAGLAQLGECVEQDAVVARVQADGGLVQHVAHALQVAAQLRRQADALRFATAERGRGAVQREIAQAHVFQEDEPALDFADHVARDAGVAAGQHQRFYPGPRLVHREPRDVADGAVFEGHATRGLVQACAAAVVAGLVDQPFDLGLFAGEALLAALVVVVTYRIVVGLALFARQLQAGAHAAGAPAVLAVVAEHARVQLGVAGAAHRAGALGAEDLHAADAAALAAALHHAVAQPVQRVQQVQHALAQVQRLAQQRAQFGLVLGADHDVAHRQFQCVFLEAVDARERVQAEELAVHAQVRVATCLGPLRQVGVDALAVHHQRRQQADVFALVVTQQLRGNALGALRLHRRAVVHAVLQAQLHPQQAQEVPHLGGGGHGALAATAAQALFDGHGGRYAVDRIHLGPPRRLHDAARVGVQALEVTPLPFVEQDVEGQRALARTADAGDDVELAARNVHAQALQVVFLGIDDADAVVRRLPRLARLTKHCLQRAAFFGLRCAEAQGLLVVAQRQPGV